MIESICILKKEMKEGINDCRLVGYSGFVARNKCGVMGPGGNTQSAAIHSILRYR